MKLYHTITLLALFVAIIACNNNTNTASQEQNADPHAGHNMAAEETMNPERAAEDARLYARRGYADSVNQGLITVDSFKASPVRETSGTIGTTNVQIRYGSPGVRGRVIWGGLVANDEIWVSGAHMATAVTFDKDVMIGGTTVPAGKYALYTIPNDTEWTFIINKKWNQHLADEYAEAEDVVRAKVKPATNMQPVQRLTYAVESQSPTTGSIVLTWENKKVALPIEVKG